MGGITIIMPAFNADETIRDSIQSILAQSLVTELIIVDDKSTDDTLQVAKSIADKRITVISGPGEGISAALNCGFQAARGEFMGRCDADDLYVADRIKWQLAWLQKHEDYIAVSAGFQTITQDGVPIADLACSGDGHDVTHELLDGKATTHLCTWLIRTKTLLISDGARTWFVSAEDIDLQFRLAQLGKVWHEPRMSYCYRLHDASITHSQNVEIRKFYEAHAKIFAKQRLELGKDDLDNGSPPSLPMPLKTGVTSADEHIISLLVGSAWEKHGNGDKWSGVANFFTALKLRPFSLALWKGLAAIIIKS